MAVMPNPFTDTDPLQHALIGLGHREEEINQAIARMRIAVDGGSHQAAPPIFKHFNPTWIV
jgi:hypothetical protein